MQDELEIYSFKSIFRCDAINMEKHFPSLLLLVCQSADQKKPDIHFFNCETVKVSHNAGVSFPVCPAWLSVSLLNRQPGSGFTSDATSRFLFLQAEQICDDIAHAVSDSSKSRSKKLPDTFRYSESQAPKSVLKKRTF